MDEQAIIEKMEQAIKAMDLSLMVRRAVQAAAWFKELGLETPGHATSLDTIRLKFADVMIAPEASDDYLIAEMRQCVTVELAKMRHAMQ